MFAQGCTGVSFLGCCASHLLTGSKAPLRGISMGSSSEASQTRKRYTKESHLI